MTLDQTVAPISGVDYSAQSYRLALRTVMGGKPTFSAGASASDPAHGVAYTGDCKATAIGGDVGVTIAAGSGLVRGSEHTLQGSYPFAISAPINVPFPDADGANPRIDIVGVSVYDSNYGSSDPGDDGVFLEVFSGTPAGSPVAPSLPPNFLALCQVAVPAGDTTTTSGEITDLRGLARPWGSEWGLLGAPVLLNADSGHGSSLGDINLATVTWAAITNRRYQYHLFLPRVQNSGSFDEATVISTNTSNVATGSPAGKWHGTLALNEIAAVNLIVNETGLSGSVTRKFRASGGTSGFITHGGAASPGFLTIRDVGPVL